MVRLIDLTLPTPEENLALDEALFLEAAASRGDRPGLVESLRFWESPVPFVVLGVSRKMREDVDCEACSRSGLLVLRRASGGGTVLQGPGCLNFTLVLSLEARPELEGVRGSYRAILSRVAEALGIPGASWQGISDLALEGQKVSGNAQKRTRRVLLHHGTILHRFDLRQMARFLREPADGPRYRGRRPHGAFVRNVPLSAQEIKSRLGAAWSASGAGSGFRLPDLGPLLAEKYRNRKWVERF